MISFGQPMRMLLGCSDPVHLRPGQRYVVSRSGDGPVMISVEPGQPAQMIGVGVRERTAGIDDADGLPAALG